MSDLYSFELNFGPVVTPPGYGTYAYTLNFIEVFPPGGEYEGNFMNKAWYVPGGQWIRWATTTPDPTGIHYPGPGVFGDCTDYRVESPTYERLG